MIYLTVPLSLCESEFIGEETPCFLFFFALAWVFYAFVFFSAVLSVDFFFLSLENYFEMSVLGKCIIYNLTQIKQIDG